MALVVPLWTALRHRRSRIPWHRANGVFGIYPWRGCRMGARRSDRGRLPGTSDNRARVIAVRGVWPACHRGFLDPFVGRRGYRSGDLLSWRVPGLSTRWADRLRPRRLQPRYRHVFQVLPFRDARDRDHDGRAAGAHQIAAFSPHCVVRGVWRLAWSDAAGTDHDDRLSSRHCARRVHIRDRGPGIAASALASAVWLAALGGSDRGDLVLAERGDRPSLSDKLRLWSAVD